MEGPISRSVIERLPAAVKDLNETCQKAYIFLRLRKSEYDIARHIKLSPEETREIIQVVRNELSKAGQLDLVEDPQFVSLHADGPDTQEMPIASGELDIDRRLVIKEFLVSIRRALSELPKYQLNLLLLRYKHDMTAKDILDFLKKMRKSLIPDRDPEDLKEQDIFYALNRALKSVLAELKNQYDEKSAVRLEHLKYVFEEFGI